MEYFTSINQMRNAFNTLDRLYKYDRISDTEFKFNRDLKFPALKFVGTVKLHGTNTSIKRYQNIVSYMSKSRELSLVFDHMGFCLKMSNVKLDNLFDLISTNPDDDIMISGEYVGPGIQKGTGLSLLDEKQFVIFAVKVNGEYIDNFEELQMNECGIYNILQIPTYEFTLSDDLSTIKDNITEMLLGVEEQCPWAVKFGKNGIGEGIVFTCADNIADTRLWFKVKGTKHKISGQKEKVQLAPEVVESIKKFTDYAVTDNRLNQGIEFLKESDMEICIENIGTFLRWIYYDIIKEETDVIVENQLDSKLVNKAVNHVAKKWYFEIVK